MKDQKRKFKGVWIPRDLWLDESLSLTEKSLLVEIDSLDNDERGCFASNEYFADFFKLAERQIRRYISALVKKGYLVVSNPNSKRRSIKLSGAQSLFASEFNPDKNVLVTRTEMSGQLGHKRPHNNTYSNTENIKIILHSESGDSQGGQINELIDLFKAINPEYQDLFKNKTQRSAVESMVKKHGFDKVKGLISALPGVISQKYAPRISKPTDLKNKLGDLLIFVRQNAGQNNVAPMFDPNESY